MPRGSGALMDDTGHLIPMKNPKEVTSIIIKIFREVNL
jgi:hypothetical protein